MSRGENDVPNVIARPTLIVFIALVAGLVLDQLYPAGYVAQMAPVLRYLAAGCTLAAGVALFGAAAREMRKEGTNIPTSAPTLALATQGVYGRSRNPIYLAFVILMMAFGLVFASDGVFVMLVPFMLAMHFGVIRREEEYLRARFGAAYADYMKRVPRYLLGI